MLSRSVRHLHIHRTAAGTSESRREVHWKSYPIEWILRLGKIQPMLIGDLFTRYTHVEVVDGDPAETLRRFLQVSRNIEATTDEFWNRNRGDQRLVMLCEAFPALSTVEQCAPTLRIDFHQFQAVLHTRSGDQFTRYTHVEVVDGDPAETLRRFLQVSRNIEATTDEFWNRNRGDQRLVMLCEAFPALSTVEQCAPTLRIDFHQFQAVLHT